VSVHGILEEVGRLPPKKADEMKVADALRPLICHDHREKPIFRRVTVACYADRPLNQPALPAVMQTGENKVVRPTKPVSRKMYKLRPIDEVRSALAEFGVEHEEVGDWALRGDDTDRQDPPF
jgi:hypothetical protein